MAGGKGERVQVRPRTSTAVTAKIHVFCEEQGTHGRNAGQREDALGGPYTPTCGPSRSEEWGAGGGAVQGVRGAGSEG